MDFLMRNGRILSPKGFQNAVENFCLYKCIHHLLIKKGDES